MYVLCHCADSPSRHYTDDQYVGWDADRAVADYWSRIRDQEQVYDTLKVEEGAPFIKVMNVGERIEVNRIEGEIHNSVLL